MGILFIDVAVLTVIAFLQFSLFIMANRRLEDKIASQTSRLDEMHALREGLAADISSLKNEVASLQPSLQVAPPPGQSMNLTRRHQVLRLHYRGDSPARIASVLQISKGEVDLLLKVHRALLPSSSAGNLGTQVTGMAVNRAAGSAPPADNSEFVGAAANSARAADASRLNCSAAE